MSGSEVTLILKFAPASDSLTGMPKIYISSEMDFNIGTFGGFETVEVLGIVESIKTGEERGIET